MNLRVVSVAAVLGLAGCGGGGGSSAGVPQQLPAATTPGAPSAAAAGATLTLVIPRAAASSSRAPRFVSPNAASLTITVLSVNGSPPTSAQAPQNPTTVALSTASGGNCTAGPNGETCTVPIPAPTGNVQYRFDLFDASGHLLATNTVTFTVLPGVGNQSFSTALEGVVASVTISAPTLSSGTPSSNPLTVRAFDANGTLITGNAPYANPFTLTDNDSTGHTSLTDNGTTGKTVTVNGPTDTVILNYDGTAITSFTITATIPGQSNGGGGSGTVTVSQNNPVTFTGPVPDDTAHGGLPSDPNYNQPTMFFVQTGQTRTFAANQAGWSNFSIALDASCGSGATAIVTVTTADNVNFTATSHNVGRCYGTVSGGPAASPMSAVVWFSVGSANFTLH
jgi:hypothetical protein